MNTLEVMGLNMIDFPTAVRTLAGLAHRDEIRAAIARGVVKPLRLGRYQILSHEQVETLRRHFVVKQEVNVSETSV